MTEDELGEIVKSMADSLESIARTLEVLVEMIVQEEEKDLH